MRVGFSPVFFVYLGCMYAYGFFILKHDIIKIPVTLMVTWNVYHHFLLSKVDGSFWIAFFHMHTHPIH